MIAVKEYGMQNFVVYWQEVKRLPKGDWEGRIT
jgi:hypothetical protein